MSEPTLEQMIEAVKAEKRDAHYTDSLGVGVVVGGGCILGDSNMAYHLDGNVEAAWRNAYNRLPKPSLKERDVPEKLVEDVMGPKVHVGKCPYCAKPIKRQRVGFVHRKTEDARNCTNMLIEQLAKPIAPHDPADGFEEWLDTFTTRDDPKDVERLMAAWIASAERSKR